MPQRSEDKEENSTVNISNKSVNLLLAMLAASGIGLGGFGTWQSQQVSTNPEARADPWTGKQALGQAAELRREIRAVYNAQHKVYERLEHRVDELEQCRARVYERMDSIINEIGRIDRSIHKGQ